MTVASFRLCLIESDAASLLQMTVTEFSSKKIDLMVEGKNVLMLNSEVKYSI